MAFWILDKIYYGGRGKSQRKPDPEESSAPVDVAETGVGAEDKTLMLETRLLASMTLTLESPTIKSFQELMLNHDKI